MTAGALNILIINIHFSTRDKLYHKINSLICQRLGQPIQDRHREHEDRPRAFEELGKKLQVYMKFLDSFKQKVSAFDFY